MTEVARELGVSSPESLRGWYKQAKADRGEGRPGELTTAEREAGLLRSLSILGSLLVRLSRGG
ncbi:transposase [Streptomyces sp. NBRC 110611]|uniref:hypothetical protein n=1 Tax=Streptomyces sp. NBRC 110611 TaxID=1621259 RepID=UPI000857F0FA|nr:transposase [Streptomyces sp. NBRC 110611]